MRSILSSTEHWRDYDIFQRQKEETFRGSIPSITTLASHLVLLLEDIKLGNLTGIEKGLEEMTSFSLWGNQTDLSLFVDYNQADVAKIQTTTRGGLEILASKILVNDFQRLWKYLEAGGPKRHVQIILDNAGFEFVADLYLCRTLEVLVL